MSASSPRRGLLIAVEGIDGAGKTTQVRLLAEALQRAGESVVTSREPTDGPWGRKLRESASTGRLSPEEELQAFINDRTEHVRNVIQPALDAARIVVLDRYYYSTIAYQGSRSGDVEEIRQEMERIAPQPDIVFLLDVSPPETLRRISESRNEQPNEFEKLETLTRVQQAFNAIRDARIVRIDARRPIADVHKQVIEELTKRLGGRLAEAHNLQPVTQSVAD
jgi:dTMP kinase